MEEISSVEIDKNETLKTKEKKSKEKSNEPAGLKLQVPTNIATQIIELQNQLKERGFDGKLDDILSVIWDQISPEWCETRLEALTPDEYYLDAIKTLPDVRQKIVDQAKKALLKAREESGKGNA